MFDSVNPSRDGNLLKFRRLKLSAGEVAKGWKAGPAVGVDCHYFGRTKPCIRKITNGALPCPCEIQTVKVGWVGYMPYFSEHGVRMVALFGRESHESVDRIPFGGAVKISKGKYDSAPVMIVLDTWTTAPCPWVKPLKAELEIRPWLLNLWGIQELKEYFKNDPLLPKKIKVEGPLADKLFDDTPPDNRLGSLGKLVFGKETIDVTKDDKPNGVHPKKKRK